MKKVTSIILSLLAVFAFVACSNDDTVAPAMSNGVQMTADKASIAIDDDAAITVNVLLANTLTADATITLSLSGNDDNVATLDPETVTMHAGEKTASFKVVPNKDAKIIDNRVITVNATFSNANMKLSGEPLQLTITPSSSMPELTAEQKALIQGYKEKYNIDLVKVLGKVKVNTTVTFNEDDKETYNNGSATRAIEGYTVITLSQYATADQPVLKMVSNPMGVTDFNYELFRKVTVDNTEYFLASPYSAAAVQASGYDFANETFTCVLDSIVLNPADGTLSFTATRQNAYGDNLVTVPFQYGFTAWDRLWAKAQAGEEAEVNNGDAGKEMVALTDIIEMGGSLNPATYLFCTGIDADGWNNEANYATPAGHIDFATGKMTFTYPWDFTNASGYEIVKAVYTF